MMLMRCGTFVERLVNLVFARLDGLLRPETGDGGGRDRDAAFLFLFHPVGDSIAVIHVADLVDEAGVEKDAFGGRGFAGVNMRGNANVARPFHRILTARGVQRFRFVCFNDCVHFMSNGMTNIRE